MIGQNDVAGDVFTTNDASDLLGFAWTHDLGRLSFWSANRDARCGAVVGDQRPSLRIVKKALNRKLDLAVAASMAIRQVLDLNL